MADNPPPPPDPGLDEEFLGAWPTFVPNLAPLARHVHWALRYLTDSEEEFTALAILRAWRGEPPLSREQQLLLTLHRHIEIPDRGPAGAALDVGTLEFFVQSVLRYIAEEVRTKRRRCTGLHPNHGRFVLEAAQLAPPEGVKPHDRVRNQLTDGKVISDIRFSDPRPGEADEPGPDQLEMPLAEPGREEPPARKPPFDLDTWLKAKWDEDTRPGPGHGYTWPQYLRLLKTDSGGIDYVERTVRRHLRRLKLM
jgi:hypothetical protein